MTKLDHLSVLILHFIAGGLVWLYQKVDPAEVMLNWVIGG